jgi:UDP-N-acetylglucosamine:LPS N-acetylglucosamine transferase
MAVRTSLSGMAEARRPAHMPARSAPGRTRPRKLLLGASGGGHWIELRRLQPAFEGFQTVYVSTLPGYASSVSGHRYHHVPDASRFSLWGFAGIFIRAIWILLRERPDAIVTTGSAPMLPFILLGRLFGAKTLWIDSVANSEHISTSGKIAKIIAHRCVCQWPDVSTAEGLDYWGKIF